MIRRVPSMSVARSRHLWAVCGFDVADKDEEAGGKN